MPEVTAGTPNWSEAYTRAMLEHSADVITILDPQGTVLYASPSVERLLGVTVEEHIGTNVFHSVHPDDLPRVLEAFSTRLNEPDATLTTRYRFRHADGSWRMVESTGRNRLEDPEVRGVVVSARDVTDRAEAERALQWQSVAMLASMDGMAILDAEGRYLSLNRAHARIYGYDAPENMIGLSWTSLYSDVELQRIDVEVVPFLTRSGRWRGEATGRRRDGSTFPQDLSLSLLPDGATVCVVRDITERRLEEREILRAKEAAEAANRAKSDFLSSMSHELRTPLNSVIGFASVLGKNKSGKLGPSELKYLERIHANGRHLLGLINDVLDLSKIEAGKMELDRCPVSIEELVAETLGELAGAVRGRSVGLRSIVPAQAAPLETDPGKLKQVLINLVGNAIKFTEAGSVTVALGVDPATGRPLRLEVRDTGSGIDPERLATIFAAFEQAESGIARRHGGTGLGLTISRSLCELMGHRLEVASEPGVGSTFTIVFGDDSGGAATPRAMGTEAEHGPHLGSARETEPGARLVLVIDDETDARTLLTHHLEELGCQTISASSGPQGLRMAREFRPDLITLDLLLPGMDGWEILRALKADPELQDIPVVIVSVIAGENRASVLGAVDLIEKPIEPERLRSVLDRHLAPGTGRVLVVDADPDARARLTSCLREEGIEARSAASGGEALGLLEESPVDLIVLDLPCGGLEGIELLRRLRDSSAHRHVPVVVVTSHAHSRRESRQMGRLAAAVLPRNESLETTLADTIRQAWRGRLLPPRAAGDGPPRRMSPPLRAVLALAAAALTAAATAGCRDSGPVRIGIVIPETAVSGARVAADAVNASGGIGGRPLELVVLPHNAADAEPAIRGAERLADDPTILAVVGHSNSAATLAASQVYNARGLAHIAPTSTATLLSAAGPYSFRMVPSDRSQAAFLVAVAQRLAGARTAAIVYENDDYGRGLNLDVSRELAARGVAVVASLPYMAQTGVNAMEFIPRRLAERPPEVVLWLGRFTRLSDFMEELHRLLPEVVVLATEGVDSPELYGNLGDFVGLHFLRFVDAGSSDPCMQTLRGHPDAHQGGRAQDVLTHDAVLLIAEVLRGGARTRDQVRDGLAAVGTTAPALTGCGGPIRFDSAGDMDRPYLVARIDPEGVTSIPGLP